MCLGWELSPAEPLGHAGLALPGERLGTPGTGVTCRGRHCPQTPARFQRQWPVQQFKPSSQQVAGLQRGMVDMEMLSFFRAGNEFRAIPL